MNNSEIIEAYRNLLRRIAADAYMIGSSFKFELGDLLCFRGGGTYKGYGPDKANHDYITGKYMVAAESIGQFVFDDPELAIDKFLEILGFGFLRSIE